jgi:hypothetical protein
MRNLSYPPTSPEGTALRAEFKSAVIAAARRSGWQHLDRAALVARFAGRASRASLYRWLAAIEGAPLKRTVPELVKDARSDDPATVLSVAAEIRGVSSHRTTPPPVPPLAFSLPVPTLDETVAATVPISVVNLLNECLRAGQDVMAKSRGADGDVRNSKLLLRAAEQLRRSVETAAKLQETITDQVEVDRFHQVCIEEIGKIDRDVARRIVARLLEVNATWSARLEAERAR